MSAGNRLLIVGRPEATQLGTHFFQAALGMGLTVTLCDMRRAFDGPWLLRKVNWWFRGCRPTRLRAFGRQVVETARSFRPTWLLALGIMPLDMEAMDALGRMGVRRINYLTDDPWNPAHRAPWFLETLGHYDQVCTPRRSIFSDLAAAGCRRTAYLPFAYAPEVHFPEVGADDRFACDVMFAGGADADRVPYLVALIRAGFRVALYGGYWDRYRATRGSARGHVEAADLRKATGGAKVALCLVRRANRDGHVMRTFEVPAMGACMLTEYTPDHEEILGAEGEAVLYFRDIDEMVDKMGWLLGHEEERRRLAAAARRRIVGGANTYRDRLEVMLWSSRASPTRREHGSIRPEVLS